jgi:rhodanese-related sulfurtransferase
MEYWSDGDSTLQCFERWSAAFEAPMKLILLEALLVAALGVVLALVANLVSPRGLNLAYDYFPGGHRPTRPPVVAPHPVTNAPAKTEADPVAERLREKGLQVVDCNHALELYRDPRCQQGLIVFIDARNDEHYQQGHIPGAYQFDHYHFDNYLPAVLPVCQTAQEIVVYCNGGDCTDSEFAAVMLRDSAKVPNEKLLVFTGGITAWKDRRLPVETGARNSGQISNAAK